MRLPQIQSQKAILLMAAAITIVTWMVVLWPGEDKRRPPAEPSVSYVQMNYGAPPEPAAGPTPAPAP